MAGEVDTPTVAEGSARLLSRSSAAMGRETNGVDGGAGDGGVSSSASQGDTTESQDAIGNKPRSENAVTLNRGSTEPIVTILRELTTSVGISAELQCTLCHEVLCKPVTTSCGHSFCRVCLVEYLLSKEVDETHCPICRGHVLHTSLKRRQDDDTAPNFSVNVTLWNLVQLLVPDLRDRNPGVEEADYALKFDQYGAKWRIAALKGSVMFTRRRRRRVQDEIESSDEEMDDGWNRRDNEDVLREHFRDQYPELRQETTVDGHLEISRNVVLDRDDANEDGYEGMRVTLAIMEFPSLFHPFNEHQECSIAVLKCEEDEDMDAGIPFFTGDDGDDDALIISNYYNELRLRVVDDEGNLVMERTRGSTQGIANFPGLRLDVPPGMYSFQFSDDLYGLNLKVRTELRNLQDEDDGSAEDILETRRSLRRHNFVVDQAGEGNRTRHRHNPSDEDEDDGEGFSDSDDSFIVDDEEDIVADGGRAEFSGSDESEADWSRANSDDEEDIVERTGRPEQDRRQRPRRERQNLGLMDEYRQNYNEANHGDDGADGIDECCQSDSDEEDVPSSVSSTRSARRSRIVDDDDSDVNDTSTVRVFNSDSRQEQSDNSSSLSARNNGVKRSRVIMESDEETEDCVDPPRGFTSNKRLQSVTSRLFRDTDDDQLEEAYEVRRGDDIHEDELSGPRSRLVGSDPYGTRRSGLGTALGDDEEAGSGEDPDGHGDFADSETKSSDNDVESNHDPYLCESDDEE